jgi:hypothetical protein
MIHKNKIDKIMTNYLKTIFLGLVLGTMTVNAQGVMAHGLAPKTSSAEITTTDFSKFVNKKAKKIARKNTAEIVQYNKVVDLFNTSTVAFFNLNESDKVEFINASNNLSNKLANMSKSEAKTWAKTIAINKAIFEFIWASKNIAANDNEIIEIPVTSESLTSL